MPASRLDPKAIRQDLYERLRPVAITYLLVSSPSLFKILTRRIPIPFRLIGAIYTLLQPKRSTVKLALFPAILPLLYQSIRPHIDSPYASEIAAALASPTALLLPPGLRVYVALYALTSAMTTFFKSPSPKSLEQKKAEGRENEKEWREYLPPVTVLNALGNAWMAYSWFHEKGVFPKSYEKIILDHTPHYTSKKLKAYELRDFLETTSWPPVGTDSQTGHSYLTCQVQHPHEPSCSKNYLLAWRDGAPQIARWVASFGALSVLIGWKKKIASDPLGALKAWLDYTVRGVAYVNGSVQTLWAMSCVFNRVLPGNFMPKSRWLLNGTVSSAWVYALPEKRQGEISIYVARIALLSLWRAWLKHYPSAYIPNGDILLFAAGWIALLRLRAESWKIEGLMRRGIKFIEGRVDQLKEEASTFSPDLSRATSEENLGSGALTFEKAKKSVVGGGDEDQEGEEEGEAVEDTAEEEVKGEGDSTADVEASEGAKIIEDSQVLVPSVQSVRSLDEDSGFASEAEGEAKAPPAA